MAKIGIAGSSFDPITLGHLASFWEMAEYVGLDKVLIMPSSNKRRDKNMNVADIHRANMVKLAIADEPLFEFSDYEMNVVAGQHYTLHTMNHFVENVYPNDEVYFMMGADILADLPDWTHGPELIAKHKFIVIQRDDLNIPKVISENKVLRGYARNFTVVYKAVGNNVSSSYIREELSMGRFPRYQMLPVVEQYIKDNELYGYKKPENSFMQQVLDIKVPELPKGLTDPKLRTQMLRESTGLRGKD